MAYAPSICRGDPEWREHSARQREPEPIFPAPLLGLARRLPTAERGGGMAALAEHTPSHPPVVWPGWDVGGRGQTLSPSEEGDVL